MRAGGRQLLQPVLRGFVGAMLRPHHREDAELSEVGGAAHDLHRARIFLGAEAEFGGKRGTDFALRLRAGAQFSASTRPAKKGTPSSEPCSGCVASSGCGISPSTVLVSLKMPAMLRAEPLALDASSSAPLGAQYRNATRPSPSRRFSVSSSAK